MLVDQPGRVDARANVGAGEQLAEAAVEKKSRLRRVADDVEPGVLAGDREGREIEMAADVLQADVDAADRCRRDARDGTSASRRALRMVVLRFGKAVVDQEDRAVRETVGERRDERARMLVELGRAAGGKRRRDRRPF